MKNLEIQWFKLEINGKYINSIYMQDDLSGRIRKIIKKFQFTKFFEKKKLISTKLNII